MLSKPILLFGKTGQLGSVLNVKFQNYNLQAYDYPEVDFNQPEQVRQLILQIQPGLIINAAAYTAVDQAEQEPEKAFNINGYSVQAIAESAKKIGAILIHYSTDYIFDGKKQSLYTEEDQANPINVYGESKLLGEKKIIETEGHYLIFRLSWVFSLTHPSFVTKVLEWTRKFKTLRIVDDQTSSPTWANMVAEKTLTLIQKDNVADLIKSKPGVYHLAGRGTVSRFEWAKAILELDPLRSEQMTREILPAKTADFPTPASRPKFSGLDCTKFETTFNLKIPDWKFSLAQALSDQRE
jgi:dTDP-4-dehydrorhamnose reductase